MVSGDYASEVNLGFPTAKRLCVLLGRNSRDGTWWYRGKLGTVLRLVWCTALYWTSEVAYHVALLKVQAEGALSHGKPLRVVALPVVSCSRCRQLHVPSHLPHQADWTLASKRMVTCVAAL